MASQEDVQQEVDRLSEELSRAHAKLGMPEVGQEFEDWWTAAGIFPESFYAPGHPNYMLVLSYKEVAAKAWDAARKGNS